MYQTNKNNGLKRKIISSYNGGSKLTDKVIEFKKVNKSFDETKVLNEIDFEIEAGKFYTLLGPSGCGKTTILRLIAGFADVTSGDILFEGQKVNGLPANKRQVNTVFQDYALFPHLNVFENVAFGLEIHNLKKSDIKAKVDEALRLVHLSGYDRREIAELSGGQQQRVAIARAIVNEPKVLLLDEPLSALDHKLRKEMQGELRDLQRRLGITFIFVTHDQEEALAMSDQIFVMNAGKILQSGSPVDIYDEPINHFVADFIGESNIIPGKMRQDYVVNFDGQDFECVDAGMKSNEPVEVVLRPEDLDIAPINTGQVNVTVDTQLFRGVDYQITAHDAMDNEWKINSIHPTNIGQAVALAFDPEDIHIMRYGETEDDFDARLETYD